MSSRWEGGGVLRVWGGLCGLCCVGVWLAGPQYGTRIVFCLLWIVSSTPVAQPHSKINATSKHTTTTNNVNPLRQVLTPQSVLSWQRVRTANLMASSGAEWVAIFKKHNSGTYNNQYMITDLNKCVELCSAVCLNRVLRLGFALGGWSNGF